MFNSLPILKIVALGAVSVAFAGCDVILPDSGTSASSGECNMAAGCLPDTDDGNATGADDGGTVGGADCNMAYGC